MAVWISRWRRELVPVNRAAMGYLRSQTPLDLVEHSILQKNGIRFLRGSMVCMIDTRFIHDTIEPVEN